MGVRRDTAGSDIILPPTDKTEFFGTGPPVEFRIDEIVPKFAAIDPEGTFNYLLELTIQLEICKPENGGLDEQFDATFQGDNKTAAMELLRRDVSQYIAEKVAAAIERANASKRVNNRTS